MKEIKLTQGYIALVDDEDYDYLNQFKWQIFKRNHTNYATRSVLFPKKTILMHREIMNTPKGMEVDHIDHNGLNCQKNNMRICTRKQNGRNKKPAGESKYLGVSYDHRGKKLYVYAKISVNGKNVHLGTFKTDEEAARVYDEAARKYHGEFANLNFK